MKDVRKLRVIVQIWDTKDLKFFYLGPAILKLFWYFTVKTLLLTVIQAL